MLQVKVLPENLIRRKNKRMKNWYSRSVFFVKNPEDSLNFYMEKLSFTLDWKHEEGNRLIVCQVSRDGFELILTWDETKAGHGRVFFALDSRQVKTLQTEINEKRIEASDSTWGLPVIKILDLDENELFFSPP